MASIGAPSGYDSTDDRHYETVVLYGDPVGTRIELSNADILRGRMSMNGNTYELPRSIIRRLGDGKIFVYFQENSARKRMDDMGNIQSLPTVMELTGIVQLVSDQPKQPKGFSYSFTIDNAMGFTRNNISQLLPQF